MNITNLTFVEVGDQQNGEYGFYAVKIEHNGAYYTASFSTYGSISTGRIDERAFLVHNLHPKRAQKESLRLAKIFTPELQKMLTNRV